MENFVLNFLYGLRLHPFKSPGYFPVRKNNIPKEMNSYFSSIGKGFADKISTVSTFQSSPYPLLKIPCLSCLTRR